MYTLAIMLFAASGAMGAYLEGSGEIRAAASACDVTWVSLTITNRTGHPESGTVIFGSYSRSSDEITLPVPPLPSGASRTINVAVPIVQIAMARLRDADGETPIAINSSYRFGNDMNRDFLLVNSRENQLTDTELDDFTRAHTKSTYYGMSMTRMGPGSSHTTAPLMASERIITQMEPGELPENWLCLMPLRCIFISQNVERQLTPGQRQAMDTWVRMGGNITYFDAPKRNSTKLGRGTIRYVKKNPATDSSANFDRYTAASAITNNLGSMTMPYSEPYTGGRSVLFVLITIFLIAVGPVNYIYFARRNNIRALLKTVPAISMGFCGLIGVYFLATEGFARKGGSISFTILDEASNRAITYAEHSLISGLYPTGGFHFSRETYLHPASSNLDSNIEMNLGKQIDLTDGLFRPKIPFNYLTITPHTTRERMVIDPSFKSARNGFELPLKALVAYSNGQFYKGGAAASGAQISLEQTKAPRLQIAVNANPEQFKEQAQGLMVTQQLMTLLATPTMTDDEKSFLIEQARAIMQGNEFTTGTVYAAVFDGVPPGVEAGVTISDGKNLHVIIGAADMEASE